MALEIGKIIRFMTVRAVEALIVLLLIMFLPSIPPYCKISDSKPVTSSMPLMGKLALNERLNDVVVWRKGDLYGPESFADYDGELYASVHNGDIIKVTQDGMIPVVRFGKPCKAFHEERMCGRPLGMQFDKDGSLIVADAYYGIFRVNVKTGDKIQLISPDMEIDGKQPKVPNSVAVASNGDIFWSDSSTEFQLENGLFDIFADGSGRLIHYNIKTKTNTVLIDNLLFANGVALSDDEEFVIVAETGRSCIHRYYLKGPNKGTTDIFIDGLPGLPDNIGSDGQGGFLVPLLVARDDYTPVVPQILGSFPSFRRLIARMFGLSELGFTIANQIYQHELFERAIHLIGHFSIVSFITPSRSTVLHISKTGEILDSLHGNNRKAISVSETYIFNNELYLGSPFNDYIGRISLSKAGLEHLAKKAETKKKPTAAPETKSPGETTIPSASEASPAPPIMKPAQEVTPAPTTTPLPTKAQAKTKPTLKESEPKKKTSTPKSTETPTVTPKSPTAQPKPTVSTKQESKSTTSQATTTPPPQQPKQKPSSENKIPK